MSVTGFAKISTGGINATDDDIFWSNDNPW